MDAYISAGVGDPGANHSAGDRPTHILYGPLHERWPDRPLIVNRMIFMLAIVLAAGESKQYGTVKQVLAVKPPAG